MNRRQQAIVKEIKKRPFVRPLFLWITGILLQSCFACASYSLVLLLPPVLLLLLSCVAGMARDVYSSYDTRWVWGAVFACLVLFLSVQLTARAEKHAAMPSTQYAFQRKATEIQEYLLAPIDGLRLSEDEKSVLATVTLGYRKAMDREVGRKFSIAGVAHVLSVSGFHVAVVCGFLSLLLSFLPKRGVGKWVRYVLAMGLLWGFVAITGLDVAAVRAGVMLSLYLTGNVLQRTADAYNTLAAAAFCMLAYDPLYLFSIGFQLSYIAVYFILYLQPRLKRAIDVRNPLLAVPWGWVTVTLAAQVGTTLLCLYYFGVFSSVFLFTNLPLALLATLLIPVALVWMLLPAWFPGYAGLQAGVEGLTHCMWWVVDAFTAVPGAALAFRFDMKLLILGYALLFGILLYGRNRRPKQLLAVLLLVLIILFVQLIERYMLREM